MINRKKFTKVATKKVTYKVGNPPFMLNTPRAPTGPERIKVAYGKVPLQAKVGEDAVQRKNAFRKGAPSISLQVSCGSGCVKSRNFEEKQRKNIIFH
mgnify:CR=1 FL=1